jgi:hypothetical protein
VLGKNGNRIEDCMLECGGKRMSESVEVKRRSILVKILTTISLLFGILGAFCVGISMVIAFLLVSYRSSDWFLPVLPLFALFPLSLVLYALMGSALVFGALAVVAAWLKHVRKTLPIAAVALILIEVAATRFGMSRFALENPLYSMYLNVDSSRNDRSPAFHKDFTPLMKAAEAGRADEVRALLREGADPFRKSPYGMTACGLAVSKAEIETVKAFLEESPALEKDKDYLGVLLRLAAIYNPTNDIAKLLLVHNPNVNMQGQEKTTPLMWAANSGNVELVKLLIERGADVNLRDTYNDSAMMYAGRNGQIDVFRLLKSAGAKE